jgi:hypothetical protein
MKESAQQMMRKRGILALDEVWGRWNCARGVGSYQISLFQSRSVNFDTYTALIPPTFLQMLPPLDIITHTLMGVATIKIHSTFASVDLTCKKAA